MTTRPRQPAPGTPAPGKLALPELAEMKRRGDRIVMITAYDAPSARIADEAGVDLILVGDSAAMVVLGHDSTVPATVEELLMLTRAANRGARRPLVIADLPFGSYQVSDEKALETAIRFVKDAAADAVKLEGAMLSRVDALTAAGIPVMGHIGLTPQTATMLGGYRAQGRTAARARQVLDDALALQEAGCFAIVFEAIPAEVTDAIMGYMEIPVIGIGAGPSTDGQVLVLHDLLAIHDEFKPKFVKRFAAVKQEMLRGVEAYAEEVRTRKFPSAEHTYGIARAQLDRFRAELAPVPHR